MAFWLVFSATDRAVHVAFSVELRWGGAIADFRWERMLALDKEPMDSSTLPSIVDAVRALHQYVVTQHPHSFVIWNNGLHEAVERRGPLRH